MRVRFPGVDSSDSDARVDVKPASSDNGDDRVDAYTDESHGKVEVSAGRLRTHLTSEMSHGSRQVVQTAVMVGLVFRQARQTSVISGGIRRPVQGVVMASSVRTVMVLVVARKWHVRAGLGGAARGSGRWARRRQKRLGYTSPRTSTTAGARP